MKKLLFIITFAIAGSSLTSMSYAQRTGITNLMITKGQNKLTSYANPDTQMTIITGQNPSATAATKPPPNCATLTPTNATVYRWFASGSKIGTYYNYTDGFCITQGCSHQGGLKGSSKCATKP